MAANQRYVSAYVGKSGALCMLTYVANSVAPQRTDELGCGVIMGRRRGIMQNFPSEPRTGRYVHESSIVERPESSAQRRTMPPSAPVPAGAPGASEPPPLSRPPSSRKVQTIDVLVQGATVELFHFYGVAIAPADSGELRDEARAHGDPASTVDFSAPGFNGMLALSANPSVFRAMSGLPPMVEGSGDWMREVANQLMGKVKSRLARFQISLNAELPQLRSAADVERRHRNGKQQFSYPFRTLRGEVLVTLSGDFDEGMLVFSNASPLPLDGKVILF